MAVDYDDWTTLMDIIGSDVMVPIDMQGSYVMVPIDIQAQYLTLDINIAASAVTLDINISASDVTLDINIAASAVILDINISASEVTLDVNIAAITGGVTFNIGTVTGTVNMKIAEAQSVGVWIQAEWAASQGDQKVFYVYNASKATGEVLVLEYAVPSGKTLFLTAASGSSHATDAADRDLPQICEGLLEYYGPTTDLLRTGGNGGWFASFPTPLVIPEGKTFYAANYNYANHNCGLAVAAVGYEI